ncbi:DUF3667 domain-containing protein [uncultured Maricaulis sp.]|uniref:DUF3667 domain-containing protein n=1 Tax=uncultured Maricaulis sp. TaxID=174710 RepID=UPI0030DC1D12|tara:strand:+ start:76281 stop:77525 length:1245 start_codon:yes stop_codon:yes gene_type:complete
MAGSDSITDAIIGGAAGDEIGDAINASKRKKRRRPSAFEPAYPAGLCSNCGSKLIGPVCHSCGQVAESFHRPIGDLLLDILDGLFGLEGRLWRTLPPLLFQPGKLTRRYLSGARARYVTPFRLYLSASVLFFLLVFAINSFQDNPETPLLTMGARDAAGAVTEQLQNGELDAQLAQGGLSSDQRAAITDQVNRGVEALVPVIDAAGTTQAPPDDGVPDAEELKRAIRGALLPEQVQEQAPEAAREAAGDSASDVPNALAVSGVDEIPLELRGRLADQADRIIDDGGASVLAAMQVWAPRLMFGLLPIYALLLAITHFYKRGYFFYDHLVVSLHFHSVLFFGFIIIFALGAVVGTGPAVIGFMLWSNYYLYRIHRVVYRHGRFSSLLRTIFMDMVYGFILAIGMFVLLIIGLVTA